MDWPRFFFMRGVRTQPPFCHNSLYKTGRCGFVLPVIPFNRMRTKSLVLSLLVIGQISSLATPNYTLDPADRLTPDTTKPGFIWNVHQVDSPTDLPNSSVRTEEQLSGLLGDNVADPNAVGPAAGPASVPSPATAPISFV